MIARIRGFTQSLSFANAAKVTVAAVLPVLVLSYFGLAKEGFTVALGALLTYPSDISSNLRHKVNGILAGAGIVVGSAVLVSVTFPFPILFYPVFIGLILFLSMITAYGHRATQVSFSGLLSTTLAFSQIHAGRDLAGHAGLMLAGGLFYFVVSMLFYALRPHRYAEWQLAECIRLTAKYLKLRGDLWNPIADRAKIVEKQLELQVKLNEIHENLRDTLINTRIHSGSSNQNRKMMIVFISLVEIMELGIATSFDHARLQEKFKGHEYVLDAYQQLAYKLASTLKKLAKSIEQRSKYTSGNRLFEDLAALEKATQRYRSALGAEAAEGVYLLTAMHHYAEKQAERINVAERALTLAAFRYDLKGADKDLEKFLKPQYYPLSVLLENLSFSSTTFRHAMRLTLTILIGFVLGQVLPFQKTYWILLTIVVIMRPGYGLTRERTLQRIFGTLLGGGIAFGILLVVHQHHLIALFGIAAMLLGYAFTQVNYKVGATFVTMYVVFIYAMQVPDIGQLIGYRVLDTLTGAALAFLANQFLWPSWEFLNSPSYVQKAVSSNRLYLTEISRLYHSKSDIPVSYRLARKDAFIDTGNLMASFQRMVQEPASKRRQLPELYQLAVMNHTLLASLASLGTYIQSHRRSRPSEAFDAIVGTALYNLADAATLLKGGDPRPREKQDLSLRFTELRNIRARELSQSKNIPPEDFHAKMEESQLVIEQLVWLTNMTENILRAVKHLQFSSESASAVR